METANSGRQFTAAECIGADHPERAEVYAFVRAVYARRFGARLDVLMPHLLAFRGPQRQLIAVVGVRWGGAGALFVEHYLDQPAEFSLQRQLGFAVPRREIVELGNFAAQSAGAARALILGLIPLLQGAGLRWPLFVATRELRNAFQRLGLAPRTLAVARAERLGAAATQWGSYYATQPELLYGDLRSVWPAPSLASSLTLGAGEDFACLGQPA